jgi:hypothetical protein
MNRDLLEAFKAGQEAVKEGPWPPFQRALDMVLTEFRSVIETGTEGRAIVTFPGMDNGPYYFLSVRLRAKTGDAEMILFHIYIHGPSYVMVAIPAELYREMWPDDISISGYNLVCHGAAELQEVLADLLRDRKYGVAQRIHEFLEKYAPET